MFSHAGSLGFDSEDCFQIASSFPELCRGTTDPYEDWRGPSVELPDSVDIWLVRKPAAGLKGLLAIKTALEVDTSIAELKKAYERAPARLQRSVPWAQAARAGAYNAEGDPCLEVRCVDGDEVISLE